MRTCTLTISIVVHAVAVCAAVIAPLFATDELPAPRTATEFIRVVPLAEPPAPPPRARASAKVDTPRPDVPPTETPIGIAPEPAVEPVNDGFASDSGVIAFGDSSVIVIDDPPPPPPPRTQVPIPRVGGNIKAPQKIADVAPTYPPIALAAGVAGVVILEAVIAEDGSVRDVRVLRPIHPLLDAAAMEAVRQWRFSPTLLNGEPVPVVMTVTVAFRLR
jgi:periplasmic protein TonB